MENALKDYEINQHKQGPGCFSFKIHKEVLVTDGLFRFLQSLAADLGFDTTEEFIAFVMEDYARLLLTENKKRLGELMAEAEIRGHVVQPCELKD
jgi:hypothetical protein